MVCCFDHSPIRLIILLYNSSFFQSFQVSKHSLQTRVFFSTFDLCARAVRPAAENVLPLTLLIDERDGRGFNDDDENCDGRK